MNYSMKPPLLVAQVLPGLYCWLAVGALVWIVDPSALIALLGNIALSPSLAAVYGALVFILACLLGFFLDALRNGVCEEWIDDHCCPNNGKWWDVFFEGDKEKVKRLNAHYFSDYVLDANIVIGSFFLIIVAIPLAFLFAGKCQEILIFMGIVLVSGAVFLLDARSLRKEIRELATAHLESNDGGKLPHYGVYTRIKPSKNDEDGVGVFAICDIKKGTRIFYGDENEKMTWIDTGKVEHEDSEIKALYEAFCVLKNGQYGCPKNFNQMPISWYLNQTKDTEKLNVQCDADYIFSALRDIKAGEELLTDYDTYSERIS
jgi:uncharacterized protein